MAKENEITYKYVQSLITGGNKKLSKIDILNLLEGISKALGIHPQKVIINIAKYVEK